MLNKLIGAVVVMVSLVLFIIIAPFLIVGLWLLFWGLIALAVFSFIAYMIIEWFRER